MFTNVHTFVFTKAFVTNVRAHVYARLLTLSRSTNVVER